MEKTFYIAQKKWEKYVPINKRKRESANWERVFTI